MSAYTPPDHPPLTSRPTPIQGTQRRNDSIDDNIPDEPPPAYTSVANSGMGEQSVQSGPNRPDFSGPPPLPDHLQPLYLQHTQPLYPQHTQPLYPQHTQHLSPQHTQPLPPQHTQPISHPTGITQHLTGVGEGHHPRHHSGWIVPNETGGLVPDLTGRYPPPPANIPLPPPVSLVEGASSSRPPPLPPRRQENPVGYGKNTGGDEGARDTSPTESPTPGRPLLHKGMLLVYPKGHWCDKCNNTGYKSADPSNPCVNDWKKFGKPYNSALRHSYTTSPRPDSNPSTVSAINFQRPLPAFHSPALYTNPPAPVPSSTPPIPSPYAHLPPPPSKFQPPPGPSMPPPPPPPQQQQQIFVQRFPGPVPPGALVVQPGDPRIGGRLCRRCGGEGREYNFIGLDSGRCWDCRGLGRLF
ncbi:hypothetical protein M231_01553 [Tremella mesenterica]|uniref:Uncharacterized protein n=1 Tax=Tremella mesenterica TaxID=5217 RepID=A0A4Q1BT49_TREME|nr:hypothetical protein M231_01553 [Tremella mesenterica]